MGKAVTSALAALFGLIALTQPHAEARNALPLLAIGTWKRELVAGQEGGNQSSTASLDIATAILVAGVRINRDANILPDHDVELRFTEERDTSGSRYPAVRALSRALDGGNASSVAVVGTHFSSSQERLTAITSGPVLPGVSYSATSPVLSTNPGFSRTVPSDGDRAVSALSLLQELNWLQNFAVVVTADTFGRSFAARIGDEVRELASALPPLGDGSPAARLSRTVELNSGLSASDMEEALVLGLQAVAEDDTAPVIIHSYVSMLPAVAAALPRAPAGMRFIFTAGLGARDIALLTPEQALAFDKALIVSSPQFAGRQPYDDFYTDWAAARRVVTASSRPMSESLPAIAAAIDAGLTVSELANAPAMGDFAPFAYDATWAIAHGAHSILRQQERGGDASGLPTIPAGLALPDRNDTLDVAGMAEALPWGPKLDAAIKASSFAGVTGQVSFTALGDRVFDLIVDQVVAVQDGAAVRATLNRNQAQIRAASSPSALHVTVTGVLSWPGNYTATPDATVAPPPSLQLGKGLRIVFPYNPDLRLLSCPAAFFGPLQPCPGASGVLVDLVEELASQINFRYTLMTSRDVTTVDGALLAIRNGSADMAIGDITVTAERLSAAAREHVWLSRPYLSFDQILVTAERGQSPQLMTWALPFTPELWAVIVGTVLAAGMTFWFLENDECAHLVVDRAMCGCCALTICCSGCLSSQCCECCCCCGCRGYSRTSEKGGETHWLREYHNRAAATCSNLYTRLCDPPSAEEAGAETKTQSRRWSFLRSSVSQSTHVTPFGLPHHPGSLRSASDSAYPEQSSDIKQEASQGQVLSPSSGIGFTVATDSLAAEHNAFGAAIADDSAAQGSQLSGTIEADKVIKGRVTQGGWVMASMSKSDRDDSAGEDLGDAIMSNFDSTGSHEAHPDTSAVGFSRLDDEDDDKPEIEKASTGSRAPSEDDGKSREVAMRRYSIIATGPAERRYRDIASAMDRGLTTAPVEASDDSSDTEEEEQEITPAITSCGQAIWWSLMSVVAGPEKLSNRSSKALIPLWMVVVQVVLAVFTSTTAIFISQASVDLLAPTIRDVGASDTARVMIPTTGAIGARDALLAYGVREDQFVEATQYSAMLTTLQSSQNAEDARSGRSHVALVVGEEPHFVTSLSQEPASCTARILPQPVGRGSYALAVAAGAPYARKLDTSLVGIATDTNTGSVATNLISLTSRNSDNQCLRRAVGTVVASSEETNALHPINLAGLFIAAGAIALVLLLLRFASELINVRTTPCYVRPDIKERTVAQLNTTYAPKHKSVNLASGKSALSGAVIGGSSEESD